MAGFWPRRRPQSRRQNANPRERQPRQKPRQRFQPIEHRTPAVAPQKVLWRPRSHFSNQLARLSRTQTDPTSQKHEYLLKSFMVSSPSLPGAQRIEAPSVHPRYSEGGGLLAWAAERRGWWRHARDDASRRSCRSRRCSSAGCRVTCCVVPTPDIFEKQFALSSIGRKISFVRETKSKLDCIFSNQTCFLVVTTGRKRETYICTIDTKKS